MDCVTVTDTEITIRGIGFIEIDGYCFHLQELYRTLHELREQLKTKTVRFNFAEDGHPFKMVAFDRVCEYISTTYDIPRSRMILEIWDHWPLTESDWVTVTTAPSSSFDHAIIYVQKDKCQRNLNAKLFGGFYGRYTPHRLLMAYFLETEMTEHSVVAFHPSIKWVEQQMDAVINHYPRQMEWLHNRHSQQLKKIISGYNGRLDDYMALKDYHNIFGLCHIDVVLETNAYENGWWTEKTTRCLYAGKPFILMGTHGQLEHLKNIGFRTFRPWINESYDQEPNTDRRFDMIQEEMRRISAMPNDQLQELLYQINLVADYNANNYQSILNDYKRKFDNSN